MGRAFAFAAAAGLIISLSPAAHAGNSMFGTMTRYDGTVTVDKLTGAACPASVVTLLKGYSGSAAYRLKTKPAQLAEAMTIQLPLAGTLYIMAGGDGHFAMVDNVAKPLTGTVLIDAWLTKVPDGSSAKLTFTPSTITDTTEHFTFTGTVSNYAVTGCTAKVTGNFNIRTL